MPYAEKFIKLTFEIKTSYCPENNADYSLQMNIKFSRGSNDVELALACSY